jgi:hypothetical protein
LADSYLPLYRLYNSIITANVKLYFAFIEANVILITAILTPN